MTTATKTQVEDMLKAFEAKNVEALLTYFAEDGIFFDPHYPEPQMQGKAAIRQGFEFAFNIIQKPGFHIRNFWANEHRGAVEVDTHHIFQDGNEARFPQVFVFEMQDELLTRFQSYVPYSPPTSA
jgi:ketosteroid isomerase-like protein